MCMALALYLVALFISRWTKSWSPRPPGPLTATRSTTSSFQKNRPPVTLRGQWAWLVISQWARGTPRPFPVSRRRSTLTRKMALLGSNEFVDLIKDLIITRDRILSLRELSGEDYFVESQIGPLKAAVGCHACWIGVSSTRTLWVWVRKTPTGFLRSVGGAVQGRQRGLWLY